MKQVSVQIALGDTGETVLRIQRQYDPHDPGKTTTTGYVDTPDRRHHISSKEAVDWLLSTKSPLAELVVEREPWQWYGENAWFNDRPVLERCEVDSNGDPLVTEHMSKADMGVANHAPYHIRLVTSDRVNAWLNQAQSATRQGSLLNPADPDAECEGAVDAPMAVMVEEPTTEAADEQLAAEAAAINAAAAQKALSMEPILVGMDSAGCPLEYHPTWLPEHEMTDIELARTLRDATIANPRVGLYPLIISPPGMGKTIFTAAAYGPGVHKISCTINTEEREALGASKYESDGLELKEVFVPEALLLAFQHEHTEDCPDPCGKATALIDEGDMLDPQVATMLHPFGDGSPEVTYRGNTFVRSPHFYMVLTGNGDAAPGSYISDANWSRLPIKINWSISLATCERLGIRSELRDFTANLLTTQANADPTLAIPSIRDLLAAERVWQVLGEFAGWNTLLGANRGTSQDQWLREMSARVGDEIAEKLKQAGGWIAVRDQ